LGREKPRRHEFKKKVATLTAKEAGSYYAESRNRSQKHGFFRTTAVEAKIKTRTGRGVLSISNTTARQGRFIDDGSAGKRVSYLGMGQI